MKKQDPAKRRQSEKLNKVVDKVLNQIFGQEATQIIYNYLENEHSIRRHEIAEKLDSFNRALQQYLGTGSIVIEQGIMENLSPHGLREDESADLPYYKTFEVDA